MPDNELLIEAGPITRLTLNRPERHNALSTSLGDQVIAALEQAALDTEVKAIILAGAGRSFCSGDDVTDGGYHDAEIEAVALERHPYFQLMRVMRRVPKPVIAQVHGYCLGSAMDLLLASDFAIAAEDAQLCMLFGARGIGPTGMVLLSRYVGLKQLNDLLFTHDLMSGTDAHRLGLVTEAVPSDELEAATDALAQRLVEAGNRSYNYFGLMKDAVNRMVFPTLEDDIRMSTLMTRLSDHYKQRFPAEPAD
jgi:2-(1,2-epoxy-1,2-dihydrophenyl)acetyl-CoA isomerase